ncbi:MAG: redoxin domain-containing protein [Bacteroidota bacterium]
MKKLMILLLVAASLPAMAFKGGLGIGDKATLTDVKMLDVSGEKVSLADVAKENGLLVMFSSNTCPFVLQWEGRYPEIKKWAEQNKVGMIVLNSNYSNRDGVDSYEAMKKHARDKNYNFYYVVDEESKIANAFGGQTTPHAFLFNGDMELVYKGAVDDNYKSAGEVKQAYLKDAIKSVSNGEQIAVAETKPVGCSIKRKTN